MIIKKYFGRRLVFILLLIISVYGCSAINVSRYPDGINFVKDERLQAPAALPAVRFSIINTGELNHAEGFLISSGSWLKKATALLPCVLIQHPRGTILYDAGLGKNVALHFREGMPFGTRFTFPYKALGSAREQMRTSGSVNPELIKTIIMSHLHWDHASGIEDFPDAEVWTASADYDYVTKKIRPGYSSSILKNDTIQWRFINFPDKPYENFDRSFDFFGDGSIVLVPLPGHTPDLIGMFVNLQSGKRFLFVNDTSLYSDDLKVPAKSWMEKIFVDYDSKQTEATIVRVHRLMKQYPDLVVISAHENMSKVADMIFPGFIQ